MKTYVLGPNAARKLKGLFAGQGKVSSRKMSSPIVAFDSEYVAPFTVQWAQSANDGAGAWIIWLPSDSLLDVSGDRIDVSADLDPAGGDYPEGWFALTDDMIDASAGGVLYLNITRGDSESGEDTSAKFSNKDGYGENEGEDDDDGVISIAICQALVDSSDGSRNVKQFVTSTIVIGSMPTFIAGDTESSEWINTEGKRILIQGYPGNAGESEDVDHSGLTFTTVSEREDEDGGKILAKIIVGVKDKLTSESWAAKTMTVPISGGSTKIVHFLGCDDVDLTSIVSGIQSVTLNGQKGIRVTQNTAAGAYTGNILNTGVTSVVGEGSGEQSVNGDVTAKGAQGSGLVVKTTRTRQPTEGDPVTNGQVEIDLAGREDLDGCSKNFGLHKLKFKDGSGNVQIYHVLSCGDIDLTKVGKLIDHTTITLSTAPGGTNTMVFYYTDGSTDTYKILNGLDGVGTPGTPGKDGKDGKDGETPVITASRTGSKQTTIFSNGIPIAVINDGQDGQGGGGGTPVEQTFISDISFSVSNGKVIANVTKKRGKFIEVVDAGTSNVDVVSGTEVEVVVSSTYSTPTFTNNRKRVTVLKVENGSGQSVFTATPLSQG